MNGHKLVEPVPWNQFPGTSSMEAVPWYSTSWPTKTPAQHYTKEDQLLGFNYYQPWQNGKATPEEKKQLKAFVIFCRKTQDRNWQN